MAAKSLDSSQAGHGVQTDSTEGLPASAGRLALDRTSLPLTQVCCPCVRTIWPGALHQTRAAAAAALCLQGQPAGQSLQPDLPGCSTWCTHMTLLQTGHLWLQGRLPRPGLLL